MFVCLFVSLLLMKAVIMCAVVVVVVLSLIFLYIYIYKCCSI